MTDLFINIQTRYNLNESGKIIFVTQMITLLMSNDKQKKLTTNRKIRNSSLENPRTVPRCLQGAESVRERPAGAPPPLHGLSLRGAGQATKEQQIFE